MVVKRIAPGSSAKIAGIVYAVMGLIFGALISLLAMAGTFAASDASSGSPNPFGMLSAFVGVGAIIVLPICYGILGMLVGLIGAFVYNAAAGMVGGLEVDIA